ncbi:MAG: helix-turn-helix transcriptional regulator [Clostridia bacterium]|nr:helix-turn-helix transcriptional regulator [Clostridia bacterium]
MQLNDAIRNRINYFLNKKGFSSLWELYKNCGVPKSTINALLGTEKNKLPRLPTLLHICEGLDTNLREFFDDPMFDNIEDFSEDKNESK